MLSPEQYRLRKQQRLLKQQTIQHVQHVSSASDTESEPIVSRSSTSTGKRVTGLTNADPVHLQLLSHSFDQSDRVGSSERSLSPAMESFLEDSTYGDATMWDDDDSFHSQQFPPSITSGSVTNSDVQSSVSARSSVSRPRPSRSSFVSSVLDYHQIMKDMEGKCKCFRATGVSCHSSFTYGEISQLRFNRARLDQGKERELRLVELQQARDNPDHKLPVGCDNVKYRMCCIGGYRLAYGLPKSSIARLYQELKGDIEPAGIGRRKKSDADRLEDEVIGPMSAMQQHAFAWLKIWLETEGDVDPTGEEQSYTIDIVALKELHQEYVNEWTLNALTTSTSNISLRSFERVWKFFVTEMRIRIREKKNVTTKCSGNPMNNELHFCLYLMLVFSL